MDQVIFTLSLSLFLGSWTTRDSEGRGLGGANSGRWLRLNAYARRRRKVVGQELFEAFEKDLAIDPIGNIADVSIYGRDKRDERSFEFLNLLFVHEGARKRRGGEFPPRRRAISDVSRPAWLRIKLVPQGADLATSLSSVVTLAGNQIEMSNS